MKTAAKHPLFYVFFAAVLLLAACGGAEKEAASLTIPPPPSVTESALEMAAYPAPPTLTAIKISPYPRPLTPTSMDMTPYPELPSKTPRKTPVPPGSPTLDRAGHYPVYVPVIAQPRATPTPKPTSTQTRMPTPTPTIDFNAVRSQLEAEGFDLGFAKIGFHTGAGGNRNGLGDWMRSLDLAGVPFFIKSADDTGPLVEAQELIKASGVPHILVYRRSGNEYDTPDYSLSPVEAARKHWLLHMDAFPSELDKELVWLETINEVDKERSEWLGRFALETARLAEIDGFKWAAFGWSSGEPELEDWGTPSMVSFLRLAGENPERLAVALHEYSFTNNDIADQYPFKVGRFQQLYQLTDQLGLPRPTVLITEWGWEYQSIPPISKAVEDIIWAANMYAPYPELKGAAIWYLGTGFGGIAEEVQPLIVPLMHLNLGTYFAIPMSPDSAPINPEAYRP